MITIGNEQSNAGKNNNMNSKNIHKLLQQDTSANISSMADPSLSTELPDKHLSLQMETLPEGFATANLTCKSALTKKDFYHFQQCSR